MAAAFFLSPFTL
jgi:Rap1a immunity proteins